MSIFDKKKIEAIVIKPWIVFLAGGLIIGGFLYAFLATDFSKKGKQNETPEAPKIETKPDFLTADPAQILKDRAEKANPAPTPAKELLPQKGEKGVPPEVSLEKERAQAIREAMRAPISSLSGAGRGGSRPKDKSDKPSDTFGDELDDRTKQSVEGLKRAQDYIRNSVAKEAMGKLGLGGSGNSKTAEEAFLARETDAKTTNPYSLTPPPSKFVLQEGSVIPAVMNTAVISDLPGPVTGQVREDIYDSHTGQILLIPAGSKLVGVYNHQIKYGQDRVQVVWTRLILPNAKSVILANFTGADLAGASGMTGDVDNHWMRIIGAAIFSSVLNVGAKTATSSDGSLTTPIIGTTTLQDMGSQFGQGINQAGQQVVSKNLNIQPTIHIPEGQRFTVLVGKDIVLERYKGG